MNRKIMKDERINVSLWLPAELYDGIGGLVDLGMFKNRSDFMLYAIRGSLEHFEKALRGRGVRKPKSAGAVQNEKKNASGEGM